MSEVAVTDTGLVESVRPVAPLLPEVALSRLPASAGVDADPYWRLAATFLIGYQGHSRSAYFSDLRAWHAWCTDRGVHPLAVERHHVDTWVSHLTEFPQPRTGRPASAATIARRLSCLSKFYEYAVRDAELLDTSPLARVRRPHVDDDSATVGLDREELGRLLAAAEADGPNSTALLSLLIYNGLRVSEALSRDVEHFTYQTGHRVLRLTRKGGKRSTEALAPVTVHAREPYLDGRTSGPLFLGRNETGRLTRSAVWRLIRRLARNARHTRRRPAQPSQPAPQLRHRPPRRRRAAARRTRRHGTRRPPHHPRLRPLPPPPRQPRHLRHGLLATSRPSTHQRLKRLNLALAARATSESRLP